MASAAISIVGPATGASHAAAASRTCKTAVRYAWRATWLPDSLHPSCAAQLQFSWPLAPRSPLDANPAADVLLQPPAGRTQPTATSQHDNTRVGERQRAAAARRRRGRRPGWPGLRLPPGKLVQPCGALGHPRPGGPRLWRHSEFSLNATRSTRTAHSGSLARAVSCAGA